MKLYDSLIRDVQRLASACKNMAWAYDESMAWEDAGSNELVLLRDTAYELGGGGNPAVSFTCVTSDASLVPRDEVSLTGPDLREIRGDVPYARIALLRVSDIGSGDDAYNAIRDMEFVKYRIFPKGFMLRVSAEENREQVRVSKRAIAGGISFYAAGCGFIRKYKENPAVTAARVIFVTAASAPYKEFTDAAKKSADITRTLCRIFDGLPTDCPSCELKAVCDEVEGMRMLHFGKSKA